MDENKNYIYILPLMFIFLIIPLVVFLKIVPLGGIYSEYWTNKEYNYDFFSYYKAMSILICSFILFFLLIIRRVTDNYKFKKLYYYLPILAYMVFILISTINSEYVNVALVGFPDRFEGALVLISYMVVLFSCINFINNEKEIKILIGSLSASAAIIFIIGMLQYLGFDLLKWETFRKFILQDKYNMISKNIKYIFDKYTICSTFGNSNYVGSYTAMLLPISIAIYIHSDKKSKKIISCIFACIVYFNLLGCNSRAGLIGSIIGTLILFMFLRKTIKTKLSYIMILIICFIVIFFGMNYYSKGRILRSLDSLNFSYEENMLTNGNVPIKDMKFRGAVAEIINENESFKFQYKDNKLSFYNGNEQKLEVIKGSNNEYKFKDPKYKNYKFIINNDNKIFTLFYYNRKINFYIDNSLIGLIAEQGRVYNKLILPEKFGFSGKESFGSFRGYIWSRTIPMLKKTILYGRGPDTYAIYFPQQDYIGKINYLSSSSVLVDKPHNMYLQNGINTGILSLLALLILFGMYIIKCFKLYWNRLNNDFISIVGVAILCAVVGYLIAGLFNDSVVSVAPIFWGLLGIGISCNYIIQNNNT